MKNSFESIVQELNDIASALEFIGIAIESYESEGKDIDMGGIAYLTRMLSRRSSNAADLCWELGCSWSGQGEERG